MKKVLGFFSLTIWEKNEETSGHLFPSFNFAFNQIIPIFFAKASHSHCVEKKHFYSPISHSI